MEPAALRAILGWLTFAAVAGQISIDLIGGQMPKKGRRMMLVCRVTKSDHVTPQCRMSWSVALDINNNNNERPGPGTHKQELYFYDYRDSTPVKSRLTIRKMTSAYYGKYTCSLRCPNTTESAVIHIIVQTSSPSQFVAHLTRFCGVSLSSVAILGIYLGCTSEYCKRVTRRRAHVVTLSDRKSEQDEEEEIVGPTLADPPPRYSWVVAMDGSAETTGVNRAYVDAEVGSVGGDTVQTPTSRL